MRVSLEQVPMEARRRAARHLEGIRSSVSRRGNRARLGETACPVHRPDIRGVAFWEFEVEGLETAKRDTERRNDRGFIVISTGRHDVPVAHWSLELEPPSRTLEERAGDRIARVVRPDVLAYVAEGRSGGYLSHIGQMPLRPIGLPRNPPKDPILSSLESASIEPSELDRQVGEQKPSRKGARAPRPKLVEWDSWKQLKKSYVSAYRPFLQSLASQAEGDWEVEDLVAKFGEGIHEGETLIVPLLSTGKASLSGEGAEVVELQVLGQRPAVELKAGPSEVLAERPFELNLAYDNGETETLPYFVVPRDTPSEQRRAIPQPQPLPPRG